jgi:ADP-ribose pyrophosphatase YjhB (NUDIX family)
MVNRTDLSELLDLRRLKLTSLPLTQRPQIRAASILIEKGHLLLVKQEVTPTRHWALPGGRLDFGETLSQCIVRELREETGLDARVRELVYVTDRIIESANQHVVHMSFLVDRIGDKPLPQEWQHTDPNPSDSSDALREVKMVPVEELEAYGFSPIFCLLIKDGFPGRGSYKGDFHLVYGE